MKAKIAKHAGNIEAAAELLDKAANLDLADRNINTKAATYALQADRVLQAEKLVLQFCKDEDNPNLGSMQAHWFFKEAGLSYFRTKEYGQALQMLKMVEKHFNQYYADQGEFHGFNCRYSLMSSEVDMVLASESYYKHEDYFAAISAIVRIYLLLDQQKREDRALEAEEIYATEQLSPTSKSKCCAAYSQTQRVVVRGSCSSERCF